MPPASAARSGPSPRPSCAGSPRRWRWCWHSWPTRLRPLLAALFYSVWTLALLGLVAGLAQALAKFSLDATIQRDIPTQVQASAFGRSDTTCQLAWVVGGFVGIALPLDPPRLGLTAAFAAVAAWTVYVLATAPHSRRRRRSAAGRGNGRRDTRGVDTQPMPVQRRP